jgi:hypothetical protein
MKNIFQFIFLFISVNCFSQKVYILEGTLGKIPIYMSFEDYQSEDNQIYPVRYFYKSSLKDIVLRGKVNGNNFEFAKEDLNDTKIPYQEKFNLIQSPNGTFTGTWTDKKGTKLDVNLKPFDMKGFESKLKPNKLLHNFYDNPMGFVKVNSIQFKADSTSVYKGKTLEWFSVKQCRAHFFRLGKGFSEAVKTKINPLLTQIHYENAIDQLDCAGESDYSDGNGIDYTVSVNFLNENLIGFNIFSSYYCGGAHPDFGGNGLLIDLKTAKSFEIDDIIAFDKSATTEKKSNFDKYSAYRNDFFAPKLLEIINKKQHFKKPKKADDDQCDYTDLEFWNYPSWNFTEKGIEFTPIFYRAARNCEEPFLVPFSALRKYKNKEFPYAF